MSDTWWKSAHGCVLGWRCGLSTFPGWLDGKTIAFSVYIIRMCVRVDVGMARERALRMWRAEPRLPMAQHLELYQRYENVKWSPSTTTPCVHTYIHTYIPELEITVRRQTFSDHFRPLSEFDQTKCLSNFTHN